MKKQMNEKNLPDMEVNETKCKILQVKKIPFNSKFEEEFNRFSEENPEVKSVQFRKTDKFCSVCLYWYWKTI